MNKTVFISLPIEDLQTVIIDCVNTCLKNNKQTNPQTGELHEKPIPIQDAAQFLGLTVPTIYSKVSKGEVPVTKRGKRLYFFRSELLAYLREGRKKSNAEIEAEAESFLCNNKKRLQ